MTTSLKSSYQCCCSLTGFVVIQRKAEGGDPITQTRSGLGWAVWRKPSSIISSSSHCSGGKAKQQPPSSLAASVTERANETAKTSCDW